MKTVRLIFCVGVFSFLAIAGLSAQNSSAQDSTGLPGDNFSLQGALEMFQKAGSPEEFEKLLNTEDNHVNNLDLNGDGDIDYVRVVGTMDKDVHVFALQVPVSEKENQDIAVIELEKNGDASAVIQIVGDEDIYGEQTIVEPDGGGEDDEEVDDKGKGGPITSTRETVFPPRVVVNVWAWPSVRFVYGPAYRVWVSPWRWRAYPAWWRPWRPLAWRVFHPFRARYHPSFAVVRTHRVLRAHRIYAPFRTTSVIVRTRNGATVTRFRTTRVVRPNHGPARVRTRVGGKRR